ncbi:MAG: outer membrane lipoprotein-sorting protein [Sphingobacteriales bacterium]|nr:outer membrane lipoprotein-sorting protein [Sphingobacteriales bacterium]
MKQFFLALLSMAVLSLQAQTVEEIIQKHNAALGGLDSFNKVSTEKITGMTSIQGNDYPLTVQLINGKAMRVDVEVMGQAVVNVCFNGSGWKINPFAGATDATDVTGNELNEYKAQTFVASNLMDYKSRGHLLELVGQEEVEGVKVFNLKLTTKEDGKVSNYYISTSDYLLIKSVGKREIQGQEVEISTFYSNYKDFGGLKFACTRSLQADGQVFQEVNYEKVELNVPVDEAIFKK